MRKVRRDRAGTAGVEAAIGTPGGRSMPWRLDRSPQASKTASLVRNLPCEGLSQSNSQQTCVRVPQLHALPTATTTKVGTLPIVRSLIPPPIPTKLAAKQHSQHYHCTTHPHMLDSLNNARFIHKMQGGTQTGPMGSAAAPRCRAVLTH
jgi:hypothetical protein